MHFLGNIKISHLNYFSIKCRHQFSFWNWHWLNRKIAFNNKHWLRRNIYNTLIFFSLCDKFVKISIWKWPNKPNECWIAVIICDGGIMAAVDHQTIRNRKYCWKYCDVFCESTMYNIQHFLTIQMWTPKPGRCQQENKH